MADDLDMGVIYDHPAFEHTRETLDMVFGPDAMGAECMIDVEMDNFVNDIGSDSLMGMVDEIPNAGGADANNFSNHFADAKLETLPADDQTTFVYDDAINEVFATPKKVGAEKETVIESFPESPADSLKRKRSSPGKRSSKHLSFTDTAGAPTKLRKESKSEELPASVLSDFTVEDEKKASHEPPAEEVVHPSTVYGTLEVDTSLSKEFITRELGRKVEFPSYRDMSSKLEYYLDSSLAEAGKDVRPARERLTSRLRSRSLIGTFSCKLP
uniref:Uncharacterized protein n=1 Tax=Rhodosorus marinus TaxID=101924 RepID=A0A7S3E9Z3_9RHOD|mmetsp:Transcript_19679/g.78246  ORF Transcript_19679/g.78246 Transcript_19679/m.78246 type:complete len:270 (+) Transcript_19679:559-1368(+)